MSYSEIIFSDLYEKLEKTIANVEKDPFGSIKNEIETHIEDGKEDSYGTLDNLADVEVKKGIQTRILKLERELVEYLTHPKNFLVTNVVMRHQQRMISLNIKTICM